MIVMFTSGQVEISGGGDGALAEASRPDYHDASQ